MRTHTSFFSVFCAMAVILFGSCAVLMSAAGLETEHGGISSVIQEKTSSVHSVSYTYETEWGEMILHIQGRNVTGEYAHGNGKIEAVLTDSAMTGWWRQTSGSGRIRFYFTSDFSEFTGYWGYGEEEPAYGWNGTRTSSMPVLHTQPKDPVQAVSVSSIYASDFGDISFQLKGDQAVGTYEYRNGRIEGVLTGSELTGWWHQDNGSGRIRFVFSDDFSAFTGTWGYGSDEPSGAWNGTRISAAPAEEQCISRYYASDFGEVTFHQEGNQVAGAYEYRNGRLEGVLTGLELNGWWHQDNGSGRIRFVFSDDFSAFTGTWGFGSDEPTGTWNGWDGLSNAPCPRR